VTTGAFSFVTGRCGAAAVFGKSDFIGTEPVAADPADGEAAAGVS
jgi:hypothetical protein